MGNVSCKNWLLKKTTFLHACAKVNNKNDKPFTILYLQKKKQI